MKTKGDIEKRLNSYTDAARRDFCMKLYGRIPMGNVPTPEEYEAGHIVSGLTPQQEFEMKNLEVALTHIESRFDIDLFGEPEDTTKDKNPLPTELKHGRGKEVLEWAIEQGFFESTKDGLKWIKTYALYGYFVDDVSEILEMRASNKRIPWKKFRFVTNHETMLSTAKQAVNDYQNKELSNPDGWKEIYTYLRNL